MSSIAATRRSRRIIDRESAFSRFLELLKELQIQLWEEAIEATLDQAKLKDAQFRVNLWFTYASIEPDSLSCEPR